MFSKLAVAFKNYKKLLGLYKLALRVGTEDKASLVKKMRFPTPYQLYVTNYLVDYVHMNEMVCAYALSSHRYDPYETQLASRDVGWYAIYGMILKSWISCGRQVFRLGTDFSEALENVRLDVSANMLLAGGSRTIAIDGTPYYGCFLRLTAPTEGDPFSNTAVIISPYVGKSGIVEFAYSHTPLKDEQIDSLLKDKEISGVPPELVEYAFKVAMYLVCGDPDLRELKPDQMSRSEKSRFEQEYDCRTDVPMTLVSWGWKKPLNYKTGMWSQVGHFRRQPYGPGRTQIKLIWIDEQLKERKIGPNIGIST
jgi:hypothetical protein